MNSKINKDHVFPSISAQETAWGNTYFTRIRVKGDDGKYYLVKVDKQYEASRSRSVEQLNDFLTHCYAVALYYVVDPDAIGSSGQLLATLDEYQLPENERLELRITKRKTEEKKEEGLFVRQRVIRQPKTKRLR